MDKRYSKNDKGELVEDPKGTLNEKGEPIEGADGKDKGDASITVESIRQAMETKLAGMQKELSDIVGKQVKDILEPLTKAQRKDIFAGDIGDKDKPFDKSVKFFKALFSGDVPALKALSEGTAALGGYLVPDEFSAEVLRIIPEYGIARSECRIWPMKRQTFKVPVMGTVPEVYACDEAGTKTEATASFGRCTLTARKYAAIIPSSDELLEDATTDVIKLLGILFAEAFAKKEDSELFSGSGNITGILANANVNVVDMGAGDTAFSNINVDDLLDLIDAVSNEAEKGGKYYFHKNILTYLRKLKDTTGQYILQPASQGAPASLCGYPYRKSSVMPAKTASAISTKFVVFGNLKYTAFGDRKQMAVTLLKEGTVGSVNLAETDQTALRVVERFDIQNPLASDALAVLKTAAA